jgi:hypothetical protein
MMGDIMGVEFEGRHGTVPTWKAGTLQLEEEPLAVLFGIVCCVFSKQNQLNMATKWLGTV